MTRPTSDRSPSPHADSPPAAGLDHETFATAATRTAVDCLTELDTTPGRLTDYRTDANTSVAVVGFERFTELERAILPPQYARIDIFTDRSFDRPSFRVPDSPVAIADLVLEAVTPENADDVAVVLTAASQYSPLVESALEAA